jgi:hypothetical protein
VIPRALREKYRLTSGTRLAVAESDEGLVLVLRGVAKGTGALKEHLAEHRREAKR